MTQSSPSIMIVAGEASADTHGGKLVREIARARPNVTVWGAGGAEMRAAGFEAVVDAEQISVAGLTEVIFAIPRIWRLMRKLAAEARKRRPEVIVLIDLPDFNLRLARKLKHLDAPIVYYISPQVWAWRQKRVNQIRGLVSQMLCILPFEQKFYQKHGVRALFVGHPLVEALPANPDRRAAREALEIPDGITPIVALLPGSRDKEVSRHLPIMLEGMRMVKHSFPEALPVIPVASTISRATIEKMVDKSGLKAHIVDGQATTVLSAADTAIVCSGTSTLQAALLARPMVVVYRVSWLTYFILKRMVKVAHIALVNLIADKRLVPELLQGEFTPEAVAREVRRLLGDHLARVHLIREFGNIRDMLGTGDTARQVATVIVNYLPAAVRPGSGTAQGGTVPAVTVRTPGTGED